MLKQVLAQKRGWLKLLLAIALMILIVLANIKWSGREYIGLQGFIPKYPIELYPPKILMYSAMTPEYLKETAKFWRDEVGLDGFIITTLPSNWNNSAIELNKHFKLMKEVNSICKWQQLSSNFLKIAFGHGKLPDYFDDIAWKKVLKQIGTVALFAKRTGFAGIALDTESYSKRLWDPSKYPLSKYPKDRLKQKIKQRGREVMREITAAFPDAEIFVMIIGELYAYGKKGSSKYELWMDFYNGLASVKNKKGIILGCERSYRVASKKELTTLYEKINGPIMLEKVEDPEFFKNKCSIALGAWPLGREYSDKRAWESTFLYNRQLSSMQMLCPRYVWIYAHGSSWWQVQDAEKYGLHPEAELPVINNIDKYYAITRRSKEPALKKYFYSLKRGRTPSIMEVILGNLGF